MANLSIIEKKRIEIQKSIDQEKSKLERNRLGQFATPGPLVMQMLAFAKRILKDQASIRFLDPAFGTGAFFSALLRNFPHNGVVKALAFEIDQTYADAATAIWKDSSLQLEVRDFTKAIVPSTESDKFNLIICNPHYVRHHHIPQSEKRRLRGQAETNSGMQIRGLAGLYCYFLGLSHGWMSKDGLAGWLLPSEFLEVNYGKPVREYLLRKVTLLKVHRFRPEEVQFDDALVSSVILWFRNKTGDHDYDVEFSFGGPIDKPNVSRIIKSSELFAAPKWSTFVLLPHNKPRDIIRLGDVFSIKRGIATGDNKYFILPRSTAEKYRLPSKFLRPILPSPRYLKIDEVLSLNDGSPRGLEDLVLIDCNLPLDIIKVKYPDLYAYLEIGMHKGIDKHYLCRHKIPWYSQEQRDPARFLCTYMGRRSINAKCPFRFIYNLTDAVAPNVYLLMYPRLNLSKHLAAAPLLEREIWLLLNQINAESMLREGRIYGGGLCKLEPRELARIPFNEILTLIPSFSPELSTQPTLFK